MTVKDLSTAHRIGQVIFSNGLLNRKNGSNTNYQKSKLIFLMRMGIWLA